MQTSILVRRHIFALPADVIFTTRDLLSYGSRPAIDQAIYRFVKSRMIVRLAWGVFVRPGSAIAYDFVVKETAPCEFAVAKKTHSVLDITLAKTKAFGKELAAYGQDIARELCLQGKEEDSQNRSTNLSQYSYFVNGRTSKFKIGNEQVRTIGVCARKMQLTKSDLGRFVLALWTLGKDVCNASYLPSVTKSFTRRDRQAIRAMSHLLPEWLSRFWVSCEQNYVSLPRLAISSS